MGQGGRAGGTDGALMLKPRYAANLALSLSRLCPLGRAGDGVFVAPCLLLVCWPTLPPVGAAHVSCYQAAHTKTPHLCAGQGGWRRRGHVQGRGFLDGARIRPAAHRRLGPGY